jgi:hypothetical protein
MKENIVAMPIKVPAGALCWKSDGSSLCRYFDNTGGHPACSLELGALHSTPTGEVPKAQKCANLPVLVELEAKPQWEHDCEYCVWLGRHGDLDLWYHPEGVGRGPQKFETLIARESDDPSDYISGMHLVGLDGDITEAHARAFKKGLIKE